MAKSHKALLTFLLFYFIACCFGYLPNTIHDIELTQRATYSVPKHDNTASILRQILSYLTEDDLALLDDSTGSECMNLANMYDVETWRDLYENNASFQKMLKTQQAIVREECNEMNLAEQCFEDCLLYNNVLSWIGLAIEGNSTEVMQMIQLYSVSAGPFAYNDAGNPDMCAFHHGTYCFTPALSEAYPIQQHACVVQICLFSHNDTYTIKGCLPGSCVGEDANRVLHSNTWCYELYDAIYGNMSIPDVGTVEVLNICEPMPRELDKAGPIIVISIFFLFVFLVIIASVIKQYCLEERQRDPKDINNSSVFISSFNIQDAWKAFGATRPEGKQQYNFLDGIRVWSMSWVVFGHSFLFFLTTGASNVQTLIPPADDTNSYHYVIQDFYMMLAEYGFYSVDSFFYLSGFLATFSIWRQIQKYPGKKATQMCCMWIPLVYLARILRIFPMMMYTTAIQWQLVESMCLMYG